MIQKFKVQTGDCPSHKVLFNTLDMQKHKIAAMEPLMVGDIVLQAFPGGSHPSALMVSVDWSLSAEVEVSRLTSPLYYAKAVTVESISQVQLTALKDQLLRQKFIIQGQIIKFTFLDQKLEVKVAVTSDKQALPWVPIGMEGTNDQVTDQAFVISMQTEVHCMTAQPKNRQVIKIGGLKNEYKQVYDAISLPLKHADVYQTYGMKSTRGVLLHGCSGVGKSMLVRTIAQSIGCHITTITSADISSKYQGESESKLKLLFEQAQENCPSIIFIDEIDTFCPSKDDNSDRKVISSLVNLMDTLDNEHIKDVVVVAATNKLSQLDQALRRPGRFEKEIEIGVPSSTDRLEILEIYLEKMPHSITKEQVTKVAQSTHGYVGADIAGVCREAGSIAMQRHLQNIVTPLPEEHKVTYMDLLQAKYSVKASAMKEVSIEVPHVKWSDIGGQEDIKRKLQESVQWPISNPEVFKRLGIDPPKGVLLYGPPGCSKTLLAKAVATESQLNFFAIKGSELFSKWVGESERAVREVFRKARNASPSIIFFDEIDALASSRSDSSTSVSERVLTALLTEMDGVESLVNVIVIAATNRPDILDPALMRPGRLDRLLYVGPPDYEARLEIFRLRTSKMPLDQIDLKVLATQSDGYSGAEIVAICQEAALCAMKKIQMDSTDIEVESIRITMADFEEAFQQTAPRITKSQMQYYQNFNQRR